ncbi:MAG: hypothetical protein JSU86_04005 [Phycisphaerales bacterium]|nr:MAG: hypothetical protein JSU86_04005 [Phycisphaerales bacterium]
MGRCADVSLGYGLLVGLLPFCISASARGEPADEFLDKLERRRTQLQTLHQVTKATSREGDIVRETTTQTWEKRTGKTLRIHRSTKIKTLKKGGKPVSEVETLTVVDGEHEWRQMPVGDRTMVFKSKVSDLGALNDIRATLRSGKGRITGRENIHREPCVVLEVSGGDKSDRFKATYWISESYGVLLKSVSTRADRSRTEMDTAELEVSAAIQDTKFVYTPPEGATVLDTGSIGEKGDGSKP